MSQQPTTVIRMPRPTWSPTTDEQRAALARLDEMAAKVRADVDELWKTIELARTLGVAKDEIARRTTGAVSRATLYRRLGKRPDSEEGASSS